MDQPPNLIRHSISFPERPKTPKQLQESQNQQETPENNENQNINCGQFDSLIHDLERIKKRHRISYKQVNDNIDKIIKDLENVQNDLMEIEDVPENSDFETSPYANIFKEDNWNDLANLFEESACKINELLIQSALEIITKAGTLTLPQFLNLQKYFEVKEELNKNTEITIDFNYGNEFQFHSVFVCPVSREQIPPNQSPYRLSCGHIISKTSLDRIAQATTSRSKFKCPTCQTQIKKADIKEICF
ncbi:hypothetical protein PPERSA_03192 [Pseudocohnilembus persalinus]|uniref:RING-Gid-type domain-containing protein n=1 Tax=Pseudocohnilembus persalinus TaxID=266149 RepID=A0A0V0QEA5_PSEPJ|nr:hypothetical protein PPERSA_03192 [Pseudocohnilembus persalinus]|eukprot:KRX00459.1 hypothetical protein PPERSA_03192 [Pseudocohnilembus persalinus]